MKHYRRPIATYVAPTNASPRSTPTTPRPPQLPQVFFPPEQRERLAELSIQRRHRFDALAGGRMQERQPRRVQQHAVHATHAELAVVAAFAMAGVADQVVERMFQVPADLAEATRLRLATQQCIARRLEARRRH